MLTWKCISLIHMIIIAASNFWHPFDWSKCELASMTETIWCVLNLFVHMTYEGKWKMNEKFCTIVLTESKRQHEICWLEGRERRNVTFSSKMRDSFKAWWKFHSQKHKNDWKTTRFLSLIAYSMDNKKQKYRNLMNLIITIVLLSQSKFLLRHCLIWLQWIYAPAPIAACSDRLLLYINWLFRT